MNKINLSDKIGDVEDCYIDEALKIDDKEKMRNAVMREKRKRNKMWLGWTVGAMAFIGIGALGLIYSKDSDTNILKPKTITKSTDKYLSANYALLMYEKMGDYIEENIDIEKLKENREMTIDSRKVLNDVDEAYEYCDGEVKIKKLKNGIIDYTIKSSCENAAENDIALTIKAYSNLNESGVDFQNIISFTPSEQGYIGELYDYNYRQADGTKTGGIKGVVYFDKDLNLSNIETFDKPLNINFPKIVKVKDGFIIYGESDISEEIIVIKKYDETANLLWSNEYKIDREINYYPTAEYLTENETNNLYIFAVGNKLVYANRNNGDITPGPTLDVNGISYNDGVYFGFKTDNDVGANVNGTLKTFDLDGKLISSVHSKNVYDFAVNRNNIVIETNESVYLYDKSGNLLSTIKKGYTMAPFSGQIYLTDDRFELDGYSDEYNPIHTFRGYDLKGNLIYNEKLDYDYGYNILKNYGIELDKEELNYSLDYHILGKEIEAFYSPRNNGTEIIFIYDYSKATLTLDEDEYLGKWYENSNSPANENASTISMKDISGNKVLFDLYISRRTEVENIEIELKNESGILKGDFQKNVGMGCVDKESCEIKGTLIIEENGMTIKIDNSEVRDLDSGSEYKFSYRKKNRDLIPYYGMWYETKESIKDDDATKINIKSIDKNSITFDLNLVKTATFNDVKAFITDDYGTFETINTRNGHSDKEKVKGIVEFSDNNVNIIISESNISYLPNGSSHKFTIRPTSIRDDKVVYGDLTGDNQVAMNDVVKLARYLNGNETLTESELTNADVSLDGKVDKNDEIILSQAVAGQISLPYEMTIFGDVDSDGKITVSDARMIQEKNAGMITLDDKASHNADVNLDGKINEEDITIILRHVARWEDYKTLPYLDNSNKNAKISSILSSYIKNWIQNIYNESYQTDIPKVSNVSIVNMDFTGSYTENRDKKGNFSEYYVKYNVYFENFDTKECGRYTEPLAGAMPICENGYMSWGQFFEISENNKDYEVVDYPTTDSAVNYHELIDDEDIVYRDSKNYNGFNIAITKSSELILYKTKDGINYIYSKLKFYLPLEKLNDANYIKSNGPGYYADYNNNSSGNIRIRIDKYDNYFRRTSYTWYTFDGTYGQLI